MADIGTLIDFTDGNVLYAAQLDSNFGDIRTVVNSAVVHTDKASQTITKTITYTPDAGAAIDVTAGGITITAGGLTVTAGGATVTAGNVAVTAGNLTFGAASAKVIPGATSLLFRNNADGATNLSIADAGDVVIRGTLTVSGASITGTLATAAQTGITSVGTLSSLTVSGTLTLSNASPLSLAATSKFVVGATSFSIKDSGDGVTALGVTGTGTSTAVVANSGSAGSITLTGQAGQSLTLGATSRLNGAKILLGTDGSTPISASATSGFPHMPFVSTTPSGTLTATAGFCFEPGSLRLWVWDGVVWRYVTLT